MTTAKVVIDANYGDSGKGRMVDYFAAMSTGKRVVVRANGGAQAGHTVIAPYNGQDIRHVFSHFGSGTLAGAHTYLAKHFVCNPLLFWEESQTLSKLGFTPIVGTDPRCFVTTPYDMIVNQELENARGGDRHGSVGVGFGETIHRNNYPAFRLWRSDLCDRSKLIARLRSIRNRWLPSRLRYLRCPMLQRTDHRMSDDTLEFTAELFDQFHHATSLAGAEFLDGATVIFEGAQGLALDMDSKDFPHVTRSNTGLTNVLPLAKAAGLMLEVVYVTRTYLTRHGAGPLPGECHPTPLMVDNTNIEHPFQGKLRFAPLDVTAMMQRITADIAQAPGTPWSVALTCTDQTPEDSARIAAQIGNVRYISNGPRRDQVVDTQK